MRWTTRAKAYLKPFMLIYLQCDVKDFLTYDKVALTRGVTTSRHDRL